MAGRKRKKADKINPSPTVSNKGKLKPEESQDTLEINQIGLDANASASTLQSIGNSAAGALKWVTGMLANIASYDSGQKVDYDSKGNKVVDGMTEQTLRYRSSLNFQKNRSIKKAIAEQKKELQASIEAEGKFKIPFSEEDWLSIVKETNDVLQRRIFGPLWKNWTNGKDFLEWIKFTLENIIDTTDPLMKLVNELQEYVNDSTSGLQNKTIDVNVGRQSSNTELPLGIMAIDALNRMVDYLREIIRNVEMLAETYTVEELNVLVRKGTNGSSSSTVIKILSDLIQLIVDCIKPYIHNLVMALILDAIDLIVDKLDKAGILSPSGPLKLIPTAIALVRAILRGDLEAIEEMVKKTVIKIVNVFQLAIAANPVTGDPSILWTDTDRMDKEIAVARYEELTEDGNFSKEDKDKFLYNTPESIFSENVSISSGARHFLQKMQGERESTFNSLENAALTYLDLNSLNKKVCNSFKNKKNNKKTLNTQLTKASQNIERMDRSIAKELKEKPKQ